MRAGRRWCKSGASLLWPGMIAMSLLSCCTRSQSADTLLGSVNGNGNLTIMSMAINAAGLSSTFQDPMQRFTLFAPSDSAMKSALRYGSITCTTDYYSTGSCSTVSQFIAATDLQNTLSNLVLSGIYTITSLSNGTLVQLTGNAVQQVLVLRSGQVWFGNAPMITANIQASNGVIHILGGWPTTDSSLNESAIATAAKLSNFGPFNTQTRTQLISTDSSSLPTNIPSLISSYQRVRQIVDLPQGGLVSPMAITFNPESMYRMLLASPPGGYTDSESVNGSPGTAGSSAGATGVPSAAPGISISSNTTVGPSTGSSKQPPSPSPAVPAAKGNDSVAIASVSAGTTTSTVQTTRLQSSTVKLPGMGEAGVLNNACSISNSSWNYATPSGVQRPASNDTLAFMTVLELASLYKSRQVTSVELVEIFTSRLQRYDYVLEAVVTYTTSLAMQQAQAADQLYARGTYLGPLHGIPYGLKDIIAVNGYRTTWGAPQFRNQFINQDANVYQKLRAAGAVLIAKLATGEMAYDDVWWGGKVKNPWNIAQGSSGSSAGPTASVVAGTVPFSVGTETEGSLMSPAATCGATAMRPSLGSIGRSWVMMLADSLDKLGPVCRSVADCAVIFDILRGRDDLDPTSRDATLADPFAVDLSQMTVGYMDGVQSSAPEVLELLSSKGVTLKPFSVNYGVNAEDVIMNIMISEAAAHFDYWQRSGQDALNRRQDYWPPLLRLARLVPAVEYIQAQRARSTLAVQVLGSMQAAGIDAFIANSTTELAMCNLIGIPTVSVPVGFDPLEGGINSTRRIPQTVGFFGWPNGEPETLALGIAWQNDTTYHLEQPPIDNVEPSVLSECIPYSRCTLSPASLSPASAPDITINTQNSTGAADSG